MRIAYLEENWEHAHAWLDEFMGIVMTLRTAFSDSPSTASPDTKTSRSSHLKTLILDAFNRKVVEWTMANHLRTELVLGALNMTTRRSRPQGIIHHSAAFNTPPWPSASDVRRSEW